MSGSFAKRDLQLEASYASLPPCTALTRDLLQRETKTHKKLSVLKKHTRDLLCSNRDQPNRAPRRHRKPTILKKRHKRPAVFKRDLLKRATNRRTELPRGTRGLQPKRAAKKPLFFKKTQETNCFKKRPIQKSNKKTNLKKATKRHKRPATKTSYEDTQETYSSQKRNLLFSKKKATVLKKVLKTSYEDTQETYSSQKKHTRSPLFSEETR